MTTHWSFWGEADSALHSQPNHSSVAVEAFVDNDSPLPWPPVLVATQGDCHLALPLKMTLLKVLASPGVWQQGPVSVQRLHSGLDVLTGGKNIGQIPTLLTIKNSQQVKKRGKILQLDKAHL